MPSPQKKELTPSQRVAARERFLRRVVDFVVDFLVDHGKIVSERQGSSNTRIIRELNDFEDFSFRTDLGQTIMGGNDIVIWHHPGRQFDHLRDDRDKIVLSVSSLSLPLSFGKDGFRLGIFEEADAWQTRILNLMKNKKRILSRRASAERKAAKDKERADAKLREEKEFKERAQRVKIAV